MRRKDIRFSGQAATIEHHLARGNEKSGVDREASENENRDCRACLDLPVPLLDEPVIHGELDERGNEDQERHRDDDENGS